MPADGQLTPQISWPRVFMEGVVIVGPSYGSEPKIMTISGEESRDWKEILMDWVGARWRWLIVAVVLLFALNNLVGSVVGIMGLIAFANRCRRPCSEGAESSSTGPTDCH